MNKKKKNLLIARLLIDGGIWYSEDRESKTRLLINRLDDIQVCIDNHGQENLTLGKKYKIENIKGYYPDKKYGMTDRTFQTEKDIIFDFLIKNDINKPTYYCGSRFISINLYRERKLIDIIETKSI